MSSRLGPKIQKPQTLLAGVQRLLARDNLCNGVLRTDDGTRFDLLGAVTEMLVRQGDADWGRDHDGNWLAVVDDDATETADLINVTVGCLGIGMYRVVAPEPRWARKMAEHLTEARLHPYMSEPAMTADGIIAATDLLPTAGAMWGLELARIAAIRVGRRIAKFEALEREAAEAKTVREQQRQVKDLITEGYSYDFAVG